MDRGGIEVALHTDHGNLRDVEVIGFHQVEHERGGEGLSIERVKSA